MTVTWIVNETTSNDDNITQLGIVTNGAGSPNYPVCSSTVIGCTYDIPTDIYNMYVYDIEEKDTLKY